MMTTVDASDGTGHTAARRGKRIPIAVVFIAHGLAHAGLGMWSSHLAPAAVVTPLWIVAQCGFIAAGLGMLGAGVFRRYWEPLAMAAAIASICMFEIFGYLPFMLGLLVDVAILVAGLRVGESSMLRGALRLSEVPRVPHPIRHAVFSTVAVAFVGYCTLVIAARPWMLTWGTSLEDRRMQLMGDEVMPEARYRIDHAVTIDAPSEKVWPWLAQLGQDRGGFYSYDWLERLFGDDIRNADRVHPEWQRRREGDVLPATQQGYAGGRFGAQPGWRISRWVEGKGMILDGWGAFVLVPIDASHTRLYVRTRGEGTPRFGTTLLAPIGLMVFEPAHFIMERQMLLGLKRRAERS